MGGVSIGAAVTPIGPIAVCLATLCAISTSLEEVYGEKKERKEALKKESKAGKKATDLQGLFCKSIDDGILTEEEYKYFLNITGRIEG